MNCNNQGWALIYTLIFCIIIQGIALITTSLIMHNVKSGNTFKNLLSGRHAAAGTQEKPLVRNFVLDAPQGWDHACFSTEVIEKQWANESMYSWRIKLREQPYTTEKDQLLSSWRPYIILLIDDSEGMLTSCGHSYATEDVYLKRTGGEILPAGERDDVLNTLTTSEGTYFRGGYGNAWFQAFNMYHFGGAMQCWTHAMSHLTGLIDDMDFAPIAVATVSRGIIKPFTNNRKEITEALLSIHAHGHEARLSEACYNLINSFPPECGTSKHIIIATTGIALHDGNIPGWLQDFDHDNNPQDTATGETGSHCIDDVAAYASSKGIRVHTIGPDTDLLKKTASQGGGEYLPSKNSFALPGGFTCQMPLLYGTAKRFLTNNDLAFKPLWLTTDSMSCLKPMINDPTHLGILPLSRAKGSATSLYMDGQRLLCTTSRGDLHSIDLATGACSWMVREVGNRIGIKNGIIVTGPNIHGNITAMNNKPEVRWVKPGELFALSQGNTYITEGNTITSYTLEGGISQSQFTLESRVCVLEYDPCFGVVIAGSQNGLIYILDQDLQFQHLITPDLSGTLVSIRSFHHRKELRLIAVTQSHAACANLSGILWNTALDGGTCTNALVMDSKLYVTTWTPDACLGMDSGSSSLLVIDAQTGEKVSQEPLFEAKAFGPLIDLASGTLEHTSWQMDSHGNDITKLIGMKPCGLGSKIRHQ